MFKLKKCLLFILTIVGITNMAYSAETADAILKKAAQAVKTTEGLSASFTLASGNEKLTGTLKASGSKFSLETGTTSVWYDGKTMWTFNGKTNETTVSLPTKSEVAEVNPLHIVYSYSDNFTAAFAKSQTKGSKTVVLTPKSRKLGYKSVHLSIPDNSSFPSKIVVIPLSGQKITVTIGNTTTGLKLAPSTFTYPKSKYPKVEIVDLR